MSFAPNLPVYQCPDVEFPMFVDNSMISAAKSCSRKYYYQYLRHLRHAEVSIHLVAGGAFAAALETARLLLWSESPPSFEECMHMAQVRAIKEFGDHDFTGHAKDIQNVLLAIPAYFEHFGVSEDPIQPLILENGKPAVEFSFALPTGIPHPETGEDILYVGRFDMVGQREIGNSKILFAVDEKTSVRLGKQWADQWDLRAQFTGYCWAAQVHGYPVVGALVRGVSFLTHGFGFAEVITYRSEHEIEAWKHATRVTILAMIQAWKSHEFPQNFDAACTAYSGCDYKMLCKTKDPERWVEPNFKVAPWNPMEG